MSTPAERLFRRQLAAATDAAGRLDLARLQELVIGAYAETDRDRRRGDQAARLMAAELEEVNEALERSVADLQAQNLRFAVALDNMANGLALFSREGRLVVCNGRQREMLGLAEAEAGCSFAAFLRASPFLDARLAGERLRLAEAGTRGEILQTLLNGRDVRFMVCRTADGGFLTTCEDVTERNRAAARITYLAYHDTLTDLPNRALLRERLEAALAAGRCSVLCLDLDGFKGVNDTLGHGMGDALLRAVAERLRHQIRSGDTLARLGGDEFAVVLAAGQAEAARIAGRMVGAIGAQFEIEGQIVNVSTSIGIATAPADGTTPEDLLRHADIALYSAKAAGRDCYRAFEEAMRAVVEARRTVENEIRTALAEGQFELHYQPQVSVLTGRITGFEALVRWNHPVRGMVPPGSFIPVAEETGLIVPLGTWVLREACRQAAGWPGAPRVSVNVSVVQLRSGGVVKAVAEALGESGLEPGRLELEVTETVMLDDTTATLGALRAVRSLGVLVAMDDFGTGYSSLNSLHNFAFDRIKIDRSFVADLASGEKALAIVRAVIGLGRSLGVPVTAEGVETPAQLERLRAERCDDVQGYLYSRPVPAAAARRMLEEAGGRVAA
ncbi:EAL domain-containing protein [Roseomonas nepalensis]|uniref:EAL domain-containing protein n=1 Tax=Muricoccus nepalensis TaxID=1854500 RepID=A0A502FJP2_9PROT|nr:EAL domain-containing protein [Roseomonas nepalensis]TPG49599.1 EAL domain-containing protein [Roseomonas nepalensis]